MYFSRSKEIKDNIPLRLPDLKISNICLKRVNKAIQPTAFLPLGGPECRHKKNKLKILEFFLDENLNVQSHIALISNKISRNIGLLFYVSFILSRKCPSQLYFSYIHSYINYANIAWASTSHTKFLKNQSRRNTQFE